ncbi:MAG: hypothetical protein ACFHWZ_12420 [Phycisphaerales bacterium]
MCPTLEPLGLIQRACLWLEGGAGLSVAEIGWICERDAAAARRTLDEGRSRLGGESRAIADDLRVRFDALDRAELLNRLHTARDAARRREKRSGMLLAGAGGVRRADDGCPVRPPQLAGCQPDPSERGQSAGNRGPVAVKRSRPTQATARIRRKLIVLHTVFSLALTVIIILSVRVSMLELVTRSEQQECRLALGLLLADADRARAGGWNRLRGLLVLAFDHPPGSARTGPARGGRDYRWTRRPRTPDRRGAAPIRQPTGRRHPA